MTTHRLLPHLAVFTATLLSAATLTAAENWPQFRGPAGDGQSAATGLPVKFSETESVKWKTAIHGKAWSSPVIWGAEIWLTTATEDGTALGVVCVDKDSGKVLRDDTLFRVAAPQFCHKFNSYASPTPVLEDGRIYVTFGGRENLGAHGFCLQPLPRRGLVADRVGRSADHEF